MTNGVFLAFVAYGLFAMSDASIKLLYGTIPSAQVAFTGSLLGFLLLPVVAARGEKLSDIFSTVSWPLWITRGVMMTVGMLTSVVAFTRLPMPEAFALIFLMPLFVTILSVVFLKEEVGPWRWAAVVLGFVGVLVVLRPGFRVLDIGHVAAIFAGLAAAVSVVIYRYLGTREKRISLFGAGLVGPFLINGALMAPTFTMPDGRQVMWLLSYGLLAAVAQATLMIAAGRAKASQVAPPQYSQMLWAVAFTYFVFDQPVDALSFVGIAIIIFAGLLTWLREKVRMPRERRLVSIWTPRRKSVSGGAEDRDGARR
ncbi:DMT family transporter [Aureimonas mangrovi]|uniref:DMT family transporter n=1 Tax=Aureimonas mangrovi TaxID=2758041 RepID=UPI00163D8B29|nr:DMT family transporter [Aureimonas mangrovi]